MKVITESYLRMLWRHKQLQLGGLFIVEKNYIITPSARGFLRDHQIEVQEEVTSRLSGKKPNTQLAENKVNGLLNPIPLTHQESTPPQLTACCIDAIEHVIQLLYFPLLPDTFFGVGTWQCIGAQQEVLRQWCSADGMGAIVERQWNQPDEVVAFSTCPWRTWQYSAGELRRCIARVQTLLDDTVAGQAWSQWAKQANDFLNHAK